MSHRTARFLGSLRAVWIDGIMAGTAKMFESRKRNVAFNMACDRGELAKLKREVAIRRSFVDVAFRYFVYGERGPHVTISFESLEPDSEPHWIVGALERNEMHEPEFCVFRFFQDQGETILDVGANWGFSVSSILASGSKAQILSFEPNPMHRKSLEKLRELRKGVFDFAPVGLGSDEIELKFLVPVIDGAPLSALASASFEKTIAWVVQENLVNHALEHCQGVSEPQLRFAECNWSLARLDDAVRGRYEVSLDRIVAMKVDVEGHEAAVLDGARTTLEIHRPLIMLEGANRDPGVCAVLEPMGYVFAEFDGSRCVLKDRMSMSINGFFLHSSRLDHYRGIGLLSNAGALTGQR